MGFTQDIQPDGDPDKLVKVLNDLNDLFESIAKLYNVCKIDTVGQSYMVTSGQLYTLVCSYQRIDITSRLPPTRCVISQTGVCTK